MVAESEAPGSALLGRTLADQQISISTIETIPFRLPMLGTLHWGAHSSLSELHHVLVRVVLSNGAEGMAEAPPRPTIYGETVDTIRHIVDSELLPRIRAVTIRTPESIQDLLDEVPNNHAAKASIDMALHRALAQTAGLTLLEWLHAFRAGPLSEQVKVSYILGIGDRETMLAEAEHVYAQGVRVFKVKVGRNWEDDLSRIRDLQTRFGSALSLYADANECFENESAAERLTILSDMGLEYCEEPLPIEQIKQRAALRSRHLLPLIADDSVFTLRDLRRELSLHTFDILNIKTARTGFTRSLQMMSLLDQHNKGESNAGLNSRRIDVMVGSQASAGLGTRLAATFAALSGVDLPCELSFPLKLERDIMRTPLQIQNGYISVDRLLQEPFDIELEAI